MKNRKTIPLFKVFMADSVDQPLLETLHSGFIGEGERVLEFEAALKERLQTNNVLTTNSGTSALHLAYHLALNQESPKDYQDHSSECIITTPVTCTATNEPIIQNGCRIKWADVDPNTGNITVDSIKRVFNPKEDVAISVVHWGGNPCDMKKIANFAKQNNLKLIEDGAHALGMTYDNKPFGYYSDYAVHSFQAIKHITSVDGGCLICKNDADYERAKLLRWYGIDRTKTEGADLRCEQDIKEVGYKFHMNDVCAVIGNENLKHLDQIVAAQRANAQFYNEAFSGKVRFAAENPNGQSSYWLYTIHANNRDELMEILKEKGIMCSKVHSRNDLHTAFMEYKTSLSGVEMFNDTHLCIPVGWWVTESDREYIAEQVIKYAK